MRIYEINTRLGCRTFDDISDSELDRLAQLGFEAVWFMGVWQISEGARNISKLISEEFEGSPYAVPNYKFNRQLGGEEKFRSLVERSHKAGLAVIVDFVSNHMAIDSPWIEKEPGFFISSDPKVRHQSTSDYFLHPSGKMIAFGRDPYFPPWHDTAQLDYTCKRLRSRMIDELKRISTIADGVRCDMAMLVLRDYIKSQWYPLISDETFSNKMPGEFWNEAIATVKLKRPEFIFIAEAYWDKEKMLRELGFELAYEKQLYDALVAHDTHRVAERLSLDKRSLCGSLYFIENHDEARAATVFNESANLAAAGLILALPGSVLIHEGQMEGKQQRLPVQRVTLPSDEELNIRLLRGYESILKVTNAPVFREGDFATFDSGVSGVIGFARKDAHRVVAYIGQVGDAWRQFDSVTVDLSALAQVINAQHQMRLTNLLNSSLQVIYKVGGDFKLQLKQVGVEESAKFCFLEVSA